MAWNRTATRLNYVIAAKLALAEETVRRNKVEQIPDDVEETAIVLMNLLRGITAKYFPNCAVRRNQRNISIRISDDDAYIKLEKLMKARTNAPLAYRNQISDVHVLRQQILHRPGTNCRFRDDGRVFLYIRVSPGSCTSTALHTVNLVKEIRRNLDTIHEFYARNEEVVEEVMRLVEQRESELETLIRQVREAQTEQRQRLEAERNEMFGGLVEAQNQYMANRLSASQAFLRITDELVRQDIDSEVIPEPTPEPNSTDEELAGAGRVVLYRNVGGTQVEYVIHRMTVENVPEKEEDEVAQTRYTDEQLQRLVNESMERRRRSRASV